MKKSFKLISVFIILAMLACSVISACTAEETNSDAENTQTESQTENQHTRKAKVSIIQYFSYTALDECCQGIKNSLDNANIEYDVNIGSEASPEEDCQEFAQNIAASGGYDLVITIGTPASSAVYSSISASSGTPVVFCAVTDPVGAGLVVSNEKPQNNCTGVATTFNITEQLNMINTFQPSITKLGVIYSKNEQNTSEQLKTLEKEAEKLGIKLYSAGVEDASELSDTAARMVPEVEAITLLPDNMIAANSWNIVNQAIIGNKPVYGVTQTQVKEGCLAGYCYDFVALGEKTGATAVSVLKGQSAAGTPVTTVSDCTLYVNTDMLEDLELQIPEKYSNAQKVTTSYE